METKETQSCPVACALSKRDELLCFLFMFATRTLGLLPLSVRIVIGRVLGAIFSAIPTTDRAVAKAQIDGFLPPELRPSISSVYANAGQTITESFNLRPYLKHADNHITFTQRQQMLDWLKDSRPLIALVCHCSNWDLLAAALIAQGIPITTTGREAQALAVQKFLIKFRNSYGVKTIWRGAKTGDRGMTRELIRDLSQHRVVATMLDQDTHVGSLYVPFFGTPAATPSSLVELGLRKNARFITSFIVRTGWSKFEILINEVPSGLSTLEVLQTYNTRLENLIRKYPGQWMWFHKRWRTQSNGEKLSTRKYLKELKRRAAC